MNYTTKYCKKDWTRSGLQMTEDNRPICHQDWEPSYKNPARRENGFCELISRETSYLAVEKNNYFLWIITPIAASLSVIIIIAALAGPVWLLTEERLITSDIKLKAQGSTMSKCTKSSLWIICSAILSNSTNCTIQALEGANSYSCIQIDYFPKEEYRADAHDSTSAIPYTIIKACPFFLTSGIALVISFLIYLMPALVHQHKLYYFSAGILFIVSGLLMLIGLIVYISIFKTEIGSKLRSKSAFEPPIFRFSYGQSFFLYVFGFISTEFVGVLNIFLYISLLQIENHEENCFCSALFHKRKKRRISKLCNKLESQSICKKHAIPNNLLFDDETEQRFYFEKFRQTMDQNSQNLARSLNQLYTEPAPIFSNNDLTLHGRDPLTRSISTTTDISLENTVPMIKNENEINLNDRSSDMCGISRGIRKKKNDLINEFYKRTGVRPKFKNIYYIDGKDYKSNDFSNFGDQTKHKKHCLSSRDLSYTSCSDSPKNQKYENLQAKNLLGLQEVNTKKAAGADEYDKYRLSKKHSSNGSLSQSRTLPRSFMRKQFDAGEIFSQQSSINLNSHQNSSLSNIAFRRNCKDEQSLFNDTCPNNRFGGMQWPQAIPTSPSYSLKSFQRESLQNEKRHQLNSANVMQNQFNLSNSNIRNEFDLDFIEKKCRKSYTSLFNASSYDTINGTAV